jgi:ATP-dependent protease HslVU (ClpYQ) peptidase subunit
MTTVAYKNGILAGDGKACRGDLVLSLSERKVQRLKDGSLVAVVGRPAPSPPFIDWLAAGQEGDAPTLGNECGVIHLRKDGTLRVYEDGGHIDEPPDKPHAWGSGWQIAATAMACGKSAREAVEIATRLDVWSGGKVIAMSLRGITQAQANAAVRRVRKRQTA